MFHRPNLVIGVVLQLINHILENRSRCHFDIIYIYLRPFTTGLIKAITSDLTVILEISYVLVKITNAQTWKFTCGILV